MDKEFRTKSGVLVATGYERVVTGGRGKYIEFSDDQIVHENIYIPDDQLWRLSDKYKDKVFYDEYRTKYTDYAMVYFQRNYVGYADYNPGMFYMAPADLVWEGDLE